MCSGSLNISQTRARGASNSRSNSSTSAACSALTLLLWAIRVPFLQFGEIGVHAREVLVPVAPVTLDPVGQLREGRRIELHRPPLRVPGPRHEAGLLQHLQVPRDG